MTQNVVSNKRKGNAESGAGIVPMVERLPKKRQKAAKESPAFHPAPTGYN